LGQIRILLADDHTIIRSGLRLLLEQQPDFKVVAEAGDGREAVELVSKQHPDVAVLDIGMPQLNRIEATQQIAEKTPQTQMAEEIAAATVIISAYGRSLNLKFPLLV
jgi:DNA-binding NarL/FixJ family response regulator